MATAVAASGTAPGGRNRLMIVAAIVFGLIFAVLLFTALQSNDGGSSSSAVQISTADTLVVTRDVEANTILTEDMLAVRAVPIEQALTGGYETVEAAVGLPVRFPLQAGEDRGNNPALPDVGQHKGGVVVPLFGKPEKRFHRIRNAEPACRLDEIGVEPIIRPKNPGHQRPVIGTGEVAEGIAPLPPFVRLGTPHKGHDHGAGAGRIT